MEINGKAYLWKSQGSAFACYTLMKGKNNTLVNTLLVLVVFLTGFERLQWQDPLRRDLGAVVLHYSQAQVCHVFEVHLEGEALAPHGVECVAVDGLSAEMASISRQAEYLYLHTRAAIAVPWAHVLP